MSGRKEIIIAIPGLSDGSTAFSWGTSILQRSLQTEVLVHEMPWQGEEQEFPSKSEGLLSRIDDLTKQGRRVSLIGTSAGGSAVLNAFCERQGEVDKVVNICGRLRAGIDVTPTLEQAAQSSPSFMESVLLFEEKESALSIDMRRKVLTIRSVYDEIVPVSTMVLDGATNVRIISVEHMLSIAAAMTIYSGKIKGFLDLG